MAKFVYTIVQGQTDPMAREHAAGGADDTPARLLRHQVVAEELLAGILDGTYPVGDRLPTESELCQAYRVARGTVRQALERLERFGMIIRRPGLGTTVVASRPVGPYRPFASSPADIAELAATTRLIRPEQLDVTLDAKTARRLGARSGTRWHLLRGVRVRRDQPEVALCWSEHYTLSSRARAHPASFIEEEALANIHVEQRVSAAILSDEFAAVLDAEAGTAALVVTRRVRDRRRKLINVGIYTHPADRYEVVTAFPPPD
jgi:DNA-binding GntR family transcriptional regulator